MKLAYALFAVAVILLAVSSFRIHGRNPLDDQPHRHGLVRPPVPFLDVLATVFIR